MALKDTIIVSGQYRLGSLGYLSTGQRDASGNAGLFDMRAVMAWVNYQVFVISIYETVTRINPNQTGIGTIQFCLKISSFCITTSSLKSALMHNINNRRYLEVSEHTIMYEIIYFLNIPQYLVHVYT